MKRLLYIAIFLCSMPVLSHAVQCGYPSVGASSSTGQNFEAELMSCTPYINSLVQNCMFYTTVGGGGTIGCAVIDSDGAGGLPGTVLCQGTTSPANTTWNTISLAGCPTLSASHKYYIARNYSSATTTDGYDNTSVFTGSSVAGKYFAQTCCTFVNYPGSPSSTGPIAESAYLNLVPSSATPTCGNTSIGSAGGSSKIEYATIQCTPFANSSITDCQVYTINGGAGLPIACAVYDSSGPSGMPGSLLCSGSLANTLAGGTWNVISLSACPTLVAGTNYWLVTNMDGPQIATATGDISYNYGSVSCCTFDATFNTDGGLVKTNNRFSAYLDLGAARAHKLIQSQ